VSEQTRPAEQDLLIDLRDHLTPAAPPTPTPVLRAAFDAGLGDLAPLAAPAPQRPARRRRPLVAAGVAGVLLLGGTGVAGALPGPAQSAFDRTAGAFGIELRADSDRADLPPTGPAPVATLDDPSADAADGEADAPGRTLAEDRVVPDATDPTSPGIDDPAGLADDAQDLAPVPVPAAPPGAGPQDAPGGAPSELTPPTSTPPPAPAAPGGPDRGGDAEVGQSSPATDGEGTSGRTSSEARP
jgi:hypothetical protein